MTEAREPAVATRVLLVEDNPGDADIVRLALADAAEAGPFELDHAARLSTALAAVAAARPDVVLLDLSLPDAFGLDGLRRLKEAAPEVPVVVLTGSSDRQVGAAAIQAGAQDYLIKGMDAALLPRALRYAIERHEHAARALLLAQEQTARAGSEAARERLAVLAAVSTAVSHSLDERPALESLVSVLVPRFADWCAIRTSGAEAETPGWITAHRDPAAAAGVSARLEAVSALPEGPRAPAAVAASGRAELQEVVAGSEPSPWREALRELGARSAIVVPMSLRDEVLGVMVFAASGRRFVPEDVAAAEDIGRRAGVALANCRLYRKARLAIAARDEFLSIASHELRTPLTVLQLKLQHVAAKQQASVCGTCHHAVPADYTGAARQVNRLGHIVESLLDVSRIVGGKVRLEREELDLQILAREAIDSLADIASRNGSEVSLRCAGPVRGEWDRLALECILANLLLNALRFGAGKPVEVRIGAEPEHVVLEVQDQGIGISPEDAERIFEKFERAVSSRHFGGLGLGLYITRHLVTGHGGSIAVASRLGAGARFTVRLPRAAPRVEDTGVATAQRP